MDLYASDPNPYDRFFLRSTSFRINVVGYIISPQRSSSLVGFVAYRWYKS